MMKELEAACLKLCQEESDRAYERFGVIHTAEEGFGVLAEEVQEFVENATFFITPYDFSMESLLRTVRHGDADDVVRKLMRMKRMANQAACEAIQIMAVCGRFADMYDGGGAHHGDEVESDCE